MAISYRPHQVEIRRGQHGCAIPLTLEDRDEMMQLLAYLQDGQRSLHELQQACPGLAAEIPSFVATCEERGLLQEVSQTWETGHRFHQDLSQFFGQIGLQLEISPYAQRMKAGTIERSQLIGYALEAYHITHFCPSLLAPAIAQEASHDVCHILREFYAAELHHDRLMARSLKSIGFTDTEIETMQPLPMTISACAMLANFARQHTPSFFAALILFEQDDQFHPLFKEQCIAQDLPESFYRPILLHAGINEEGKHEDVGGQLLHYLNCIPWSDQQLVKKNMVLLLESFIMRSREILEYYSEGKNLIPRCF
ncbi:iron-containing redox enzyme family protein [Lyngbya confervoides]|uniref:Iron-containing redox enzyme family protein n=1 Tax=Lyngbya confervoides BDU141951 TaxID=1574623 RepID=A0ABD4T4I5_9CYAN|nr:iron-containing redox enzyme family protein [Lyngbya confervoides]MCM1983598.1 iron-containing redox enzyme family protein [Lyngbya confervoides BDU141951]